MVYHQCSFDKNTNKNIFFYFLTSYQYVYLVVIAKFTIHFKVLEYGYEAIISLREMWITRTRRLFCVLLRKVLAFFLLYLESCIMLKFGIFRIQAVKIDYGL